MLSCKLGPLNVSIPMQGSFNSKRTHIMITNNAVGLTETLALLSRNNPKIGSGFCITAEQIAVMLQRGGSAAEIKWVLVYGWHYTMQL